MQPEDGNVYVRMNKEVIIDANTCPETYAAGTEMP